MAAMKKRITITLFFCILIVYVLFCPDGLQKELTFLPSWSLELSAADMPAAGGTDLIPFKLDDRLGYFSRSGALAYSELIVYDAVVAENYFINYSSVSRNLAVQDSSGKILGNIVTEGLPFQLNQRSFIISPDRMTVSEHENGSLLWTVTPGSMITSIDVNDELTLLGLMNGEVLLYDNEGGEIFSFFSTESRYSIAYSCALSEDGGRIAVVAGLEPQQLICFEEKNESYMLVLRKNMEHQYRRNLFMDYSSDGKLLYVESPAGLDIVNSMSLEEDRIALEGIISAASLNGDSELSYLLLENEKESVLRIFRHDVGRIAAFSLPGGSLYFNPAEKCFYVGWNGIIVRYDIIEG